MRGHFVNNEVIGMIEEEYYEPTFDDEDYIGGDKEDPNN